MGGYEFPEVYVEGIKGRDYICRASGGYVLARERISDKCFGHILYEDVVDKALDLVDAVFTRSIIVIPRYRPGAEIEALLVERGARACLMEIRGHDPLVFVREGDEVREKDKIAYIVTGKGEVRVYKSVCSGVVTLVINYPWERPERYVVVVVDKDAARRVTIKGS